jgi:hypothetical protein
LDNDKEVFIGFAAEKDGEMKYIAPDGATVLFQRKSKDIHGYGRSLGGILYKMRHRARNIWVQAAACFSPDTGMTRAMFATVIGRLYERSYGEISISGARAFTDCDYDDY